MSRRSRFDVVERLSDASASRLRRPCASAGLRFVIAAALCVAQAMSSATLRAEDAAPANVFDSIQSQVGQLFDRCRSAVVRIEATDDHGQLAGTGFFIDPNGTLYTSYTIGGESRDIVVTQGDLKYSARRVVADPRCGVAILQVDAQTPFLMLGSSRELKVASPVMAVGFPMDLPLSPSFGVVGGFDRKYLGRFFATTHIRANVPVQRGQGGAPLLNMRGEAVGILISSMDSGSAAFVLPIEAAEKVRRDYVRFGDVRPGWMGIEVRPAPEPTGGSTAMVHEVFPGAPAASAGVRPGDVLLQIGTISIVSTEDLLDASFFSTAEDPLTVKLARGQETMDLTLQPADLPGRRREPQPALGSTMEPGAKPLRIAE
jgi:serine protease Do